MKQSGDVNTFKFLYKSHIKNDVDAACIFLYKLLENPFDIIF